MSTEPVQVCMNYEARMLRLTRAATNDGRVSMRLLPIVLESTHRIDTELMHTVVEELVQSFHLFQVTFRKTDTGANVYDGESPCSIRLSNESRVSVSLRDGFHASDLMRLEVRNSRSSRTAVLRLDHLLADGITSAIVGNWLARRYNGEDIGKIEERRYVDFAQWQQAYLASSAGSEAVKQRLAQVEPYGLAPPSPLIATGARPLAGELPSAVKASVILTEACAEGHLELTRSGVTAYMLALAATLLAMRKHGISQQPAVVGITAGRFMSGYANTAGWLANLTVLGAYLSDSMSLGDVAQAARLSVVSALCHEKVPYHALVRQQAPEMFGVFPATPWIFLADTSEVLPSAPIADGSLVLREDVMGSGRRVHNMVVSMRPSIGRLDFVIDYPTSLYRRRDVELFARSISYAARSLLLSPDRRVSDWLR